MTKNTMTSDESSSICIDDNKSIHSNTTSMSHRFIDEISVNRTPTDTNSSIRIDFTFDPSKNIDFSIALNRLLDGEKIKRTDWDGYLIKKKDGVYMCRHDRETRIQHIFLSDILSNDWEIVR